MKRTRKVLFLCAIAALVTFGAHADNLSLNIPARAELPIAKVQIRLTVTGGPLTLNVAGTDVANDGLFHTLPNTDEVLFIASASAALIKYFPHNILVPASNCVAKVAPNDTETVAMTTGFTVSDYRIDSYTVPTNLFGCNVISRRIGLTVATLSGAGTNLGRNRLNVVMILDKSGSMGDPPPGGGAASKWDILKAGLSSFLGQWELESNAPTDDDIAVVLFDNTAQVAVIPTSTDTYLRRSQGLSHVNDLFTGGGAPSPGGSTSIGGGLVSAKSINETHALTDPVGDPVFILITDGMQNTQPMVHDLNPQTVDTVAAILPDWGAPIQTVAFGGPVTTDTNLLDHMANQTLGKSLEPITDLGMASTLAQHLVNTLKGNTVSLALNIEGSVSHGFGPVHTFLVDGSVSRIIFNLQWRTNSIPNGLGLQVFPPGADPATATPLTTIHRDAQFSTAQAIDVTPATAGTWSVRAVGMQANTNERPFQYSLTAILQETRLDYAFLFESPNQGTGDRIKLRAEVAWLGQPLTGLGSNAIRATISRPNEAIGTILHGTDVPPSVLDPNSPPPDSTRLSRKVKAVAQNGDLLNRVKPQQVTTIALQDDGNGNYSGTFDDTSVPGQYEFDVMLEWDTQQTGHIKRFEHVVHEVVVKPDADHTLVSKTDNGNGTWTVSITPKDKFGNFYGPGALPTMKFTVDPPATILTPLSDPNESGTYVATIGNVPAGQEPHVNASVDGNTVAPAGGGGSSSGKYRWFLDIGPNFPHGSFSNGVDGKFSVNTGFEKLLSGNNSVELIAGYHLFDVAFLSNPHIWQLSFGGKHYFGSTPLHPFVNAAAGAYRFDPGATTKAGANAGFGVLYDLSSVWGIEGVYNYHWINTSVSKSKFSTLQIGIRRSF
jgi:uncharacterized protein YegL